MFLSFELVGLSGRIIFEVKIGGGCQPVKAALLKLCSLFADTYGKDKGAGAGLCRINVARSFWSVGESILNIVIDDSIIF